MKLYKVLNKNGELCHGGSGKWYLPKGNRPGRWMPKIEGELIPCQNGYHLCRTQDLICWLGDNIYEAEHRGEIGIGNDKVVVRQARLLHKVETWNETTARLFACDCAEHASPIHERAYAAAWAAAGEAAAGAAAGAAAAWDAERQWQTQRLIKLLGLEE